MSLTSLVGMADVREKLKPFRPAPPRKIPAALRAKPKSNLYQLVGTAFDYLLRFELQRRAPHAIEREWVAELAPERIWKKNESGGCSWRDVFKLMDTNSNDFSEVGERMREVAERARKIVTDAKAAVAAYLKLRRPNRSKRADLAAHAIRLAKLDSVRRACKLDPQFEEAAPEDVEDLLNLLAIVPWDSLLHDKILLLNPSFGQTSELVGGTDADLITGDMLVDFKATRKSEMQPRDLDQLFGYYLLARHQHMIDPTFPEINLLALYFCRHGHLWVENTTTWTNNPQFSEVEEWFFKRAKEAFGLA